MPKRRDRNQNLTIPRHPIRFGRWAVFPAAGFCIYCGREDAPLTDEHIIPAALGGDVVLPHATCGVCQSIINTQVEQPLNDLNVGTFGPLRLSLGIRPRKGSLKKDGINLSVMNAIGEERSIRVAVADIPPMLVGMITGRKAPGIIAGRDILDEVGGNLCVLYHQEKTNRIINSEEALFGLVNFNALTMARLIAKIAHGVAYATYGKLFEPYLVDLILGRSAVIEHFIGSYILPTTGLGGLHSASAGLAGTDHEHIIVKIKLFCAFYTPSYTVAVGKRCGSLEDFGIFEHQNSHFGVK